MALYDLVTLKQNLQQLTAQPLAEEIAQLQHRLKDINLQLDNIPQHREHIKQIIRDYDAVAVQAMAPMELVKRKLEALDHEIHTLTHQLFAGNYDLEEYCRSADMVRNTRRITIGDEEVEMTIKHRIFLHTNWRYPALEIGCRDGEWTQYLVAADPLYIMDRHEEFLTSTNSKFPEQYQHRLRKYLLNHHFLGELPQAQFGFVFSWGYFNYVSLDTMRRYLSQVFDLLRPGGIFMFSYNDGDTPAGAGMAENFAQSYMPKSLLIALAESLGYEIMETTMHSTNIHWIEIKRPGVMTTIKAHQALGEIRRHQ
jgi:SAM-dependent methyltransferase